MAKDRRSGCPISYSLDVFGDRWTLLVLRDMVFGGKRYYRDFLAAPEGIATNVLADRLKRLESAGLVEKHPDEADRKRNRYALTEKGLDTIPILVDMIAWGVTYDPETGAPAEFRERVRGDRDAVIAEVRQNLSASG